MFGRYALLAFSERLKREQNGINELIGRSFRRKTTDTTKHAGADHWLPGKRQRKVSQCTLRLDNSLDYTTGDTIRLYGDGTLQTGGQ